MGRTSKIIAIVSLLVLSPVFTGLVFAGEQSHWSSMPIGVKDTMMPPKGFYVAAFDMYYSSDTFKNRDGNTFKSLSATTTATTDLSILGHSVPVTITGNLAANFDIDIGVDISGNGKGDRLAEDSKVSRRGSRYG